MKIEYFNTPFVFLQYIKNEPLLIKTDRKYARNHGYF